MFHLIYDPKDDTCLIANVDFQHTIIAVYREKSSIRSWNSFKDAALKTFEFGYNITNEHNRYIRTRESYFIDNTN